GVAEALGQAGEVEGDLAGHGDDPPNSTSTGWPGLSCTDVASSKRSSTMKTSFPRLSWLKITGGVYSTCGEMKLTLPANGPAPPSTRTRAWSPGWIVATTACGTNARTLRLAGGRSATTRRPAATH